MSFARIIGTGGYLPSNVVTNHDLEKLVDTSDQWIRERTGIEQRHIAVDGETTVDLAEQASRNAIEAAAILSSRCAREVVPGIGKTCGALCRSQARASWAGLHAASAAATRK